MSKRPAPRHICITGASSGLGEALALTYAEPGVRLLLTGQNPVRCKAIAEACRQRGATVESVIVDVTDTDAMAVLLRAADDLQPLDLVIANAGIAESAADPRRVFEVNVIGVVNTIEPVLDRMKHRGSGQLALVSSIAGYRGLPGAAAYSASKAAVRAWGEALRGQLAPHGIGVSTILPGFVVSRITERNTFPMPFLMPADKAAALIRRRLARNRARIAFPWQMALTGWLLSALPGWLCDRLVRRLPAKEG